MKIVEKEVKALKPYENNPRINDEAADFVAKSIKDFGFLQPIVIDKDDIIVCGHTRWKAARKLGLKTVPCVLADDLTEEQINEYRILDNKTGELSYWNYDLLNEEMEEIEFDMSAFGFSDFELGKDHVTEMVKEHLEQQGIETAKQYFEIKLDFPNTEKELITDYLRKHKKDEFVSYIMTEAVK